MGTTPASKKAYHFQWRRKRQQAAADAREKTRKESLISCLDDFAFCYWLAGMIDGEGCFTLAEQTKKGKLIAISCVFSLTLRDDDKAIIEYIKSRTGIGTTCPMAENCWRWAIQDSDGAQSLIDILDKYPLRTRKSRDYFVWKEAVGIWRSRRRGDSWLALSALRTKLILVRKYVR